MARKRTSRQAPSNGEKPQQKQSNQRSSSSSRSESGNRSRSSSRGGKSSRPKPARPEHAVVADDDDDLEIPSYGRTTIDDELPPWEESDFVDDEPAAPKKKSRRRGKAKRSSQASEDRPESSREGGSRSGRPSRDRDEDDDRSGRGRKTTRTEAVVEDDVEPESKPKRKRGRRKKKTSEAAEPEARREAPPQRRREEADEAPTSGRRKKKRSNSAERSEDKPREESRSRRREEVDEEPTSGRRKKKRSSSAERSEDKPREESRSRRSSRGHRDEVEEAPPQRRRQPEKAEDEPPKRRRRSEERAEEAPRDRRRREEDIDEAPAPRRKKAKREEARDEESRGRRKQAKRSEEPRTRESRREAEPAAEDRDEGRRAQKMRPKAEPASADREPAEKSRPKREPAQSRRKKRPTGDFGGVKVSDEMLRALDAADYKEPTPIQKGLIPRALEGVDVMGQAQTGTGKTAAFAIPILERIDDEAEMSPQALVLVPTRELAVQVRDETRKLAAGRDVQVIACYGGKPIRKQANQLREGAEVVVGTPGRLLDLMRRGVLSLDGLSIVVLDEADRMLDIGFRPDIEKILRRCPKDRQTLLLSATLPAPVVRLAERYMQSPETLDFSEKDISVSTIEQFYVTVEPERKFDALVHLLRQEDPTQAIIFCRTKRGADKIHHRLAKQFESVASIHGDLTQAVRDRVMRQFRKGTTKILVATDVVGRGIDVSGISHIINYDIPAFSDDYVHRVGRTGRMGREGVAFTFVAPEEGKELTRIEIRINRLLKRATIENFTTYVPAEADEAEEADAKPVYGRSRRRVRRAL